jgi:hypothetical protein
MAGNSVAACPCSDQMGRMAVQRCSDDGRRWVQVGVVAIFAQVYVTEYVCPVQQ